MTVLGAVPFIGTDQVHAKDLVALACDVIVAGSAPDVAALLRETRAVPIVFAASADPIGSGASLQALRARVEMRRGSAAIKPRSPQSR